MRLALGSGIGKTPGWRQGDRAEETFGQSKQENPLSTQVALSPRAGAEKVEAETFPMEAWISEMTLGLF